MIVHQLVGAAGPVDAVTNQVLAWRRRFGAWGWGGGDFAERIAPEMGSGAIAPLDEYRPSAGEVTLLHFSGHVPELERRIAHPYALLSHNVTPPEHFWALEPREAIQSSRAPDQLVRLARGSAFAAGVSAYNAADLGVDAPDVIPILFERPAAAPGPQPPDGPPTVLFVGRLAPHKRQDLVLRAFARYQRLHAPDARLFLVGVPTSPGFGERLRGLAEELAPGAVTFETGIAADALADRYRSAHAFLCLSEHEGFCVPLLEAMHFGVPVITRATGGIPEVVGDAAVVLGAGDDLGVVAELLHLAATETGLRETLRSRGAQRLEHFEADRVAARMRARLEALA